MDEMKLVTRGERGIERVNPAAIAAAELEKARIQSAYIVAMRNPRQELEAGVNIINACKRPTFAGKVEWKRVIGGEDLSGPTIRFAEECLKQWGNVMTGQQTLFEDEENRITRVSVIDLETNATYWKDLTIKKTVERRYKEGREVVGERVNSKKQITYICKATDEEFNIKEAALVARIIRNEALRLIPADIVEDAILQARQTIMDGITKDPTSAMKIMVMSFDKLGIPASEIERYLRHSLKGISPAEHLDLQTIYNAIKQGGAKWSDYFEPSDENTTKVGKEALAGLKNRPQGKEEKEAPPHDPKTGEITPDEGKKGGEEESKGKDPSEEKEPPEKPSEKPPAEVKKAGRPKVAGNW